MKKPAQTVKRPELRIIENVLPRSVRAVNPYSSLGSTTDQILASNCLHLTVSRRSRYPSLAELAAHGLT